MWILAAAATAIGLLALAALVGSATGPDEGLDVLPVVGDAVERTLRRPVVAAVLASALLVLLVAAVRGARLRWLAWR